MVLHILIPTRSAPFQVASPPLAASRWQRTRRANRRRAARTPAPEGQRLRTQLVRHWLPVAVHTRPAPLPRPEPRERASVSSRGLLKQCEGLLRALCRHRFRTLALRQANIAGVARRFEVDRYAAVGDTAALAYVLALMHWRGCSVPNFLLRPPLHPPTGLVRWLSAYSVVDEAGICHGESASAHHRARRVSPRRVRDLRAFARHRATCSMATRLRALPGLSLHRPMKCPRGSELPPGSRCRPPARPDAAS